MCLEEMLGMPVPSGYVWYGANRRRSRVDFTEELRASVQTVVQAIRSHMRHGRLPLAPNDERCTECQLRYHCLPEISDGRDRISRYLKKKVFECDI